MGENSAGQSSTDWWWGYNSFDQQHFKQWHHLAMVKDTDQAIEKLYYDGIEVASFTCDPAKTMQDIEEFAFFARVTSSPQWWDSFHGKMDDLRIYDRALTQEEIKRLATPQDINQDNYVDFYDVKLFAENWLDDSMSDSDINKDAIVNFTDYALLINAWRQPRRFYFDSENGSNTNSGTSPSQPWLSLSKFNATTFLPGDHIYFKAGCTWTGQLKPRSSGTDQDPIIIDAYGDISNENNKPRFDGNGTVNPTLYVKNVEHWEINNLQVTNLGATTAQWRRAISVTADRFGQMDHIYLKNLYIHSVNGELSVFGGGNAINIGVTESSTEQSHLNDILIENCHFQTVDNVAILGGGGYPTDKEGPQGTNIVIRNNYFEDIGGAAICLIGSDGAIVESNVVNGAILREANCAIWPFAADNTIIQYNEVYNCADNGDGEAYDADYQCDGTIFQYNYSHDNPGGFMRICNGDPGAGHYNTNTIVRYNISVNDGKSDDALIELWKRLDNCQVYNNILYIPQNRGTIDFVGSNMYGGGDGGSNYWYNNIFFAASGSTGRFSVDDGSSNTWSNNCFYGSMKTGSVLGAFGVYWWSYSNGTPSDPAKITSNPMFINPGSHLVGDNLEGYKLQLSSPCINAGTPITNNGSYDFWGNILYNGNPDIGAYEH